MQETLIMIVSKATTLYIYKHHYCISLKRPLKKESDPHNSLHIAKKELTMSSKVRSETFPRTKMMSPNRAGSDREYSF